MFHCYNTCQFKNLGLQANVGCADITMLFSSITNRISTFASKISILYVIFHDSEFYSWNLLGAAFLEFVKVREFYKIFKKL